MNRKYINHGQLIGGATMLGMAGGWLLGDLKIGLFIGIGLGMIISALSNQKSKENNNGK